MLEHYTVGTSPKAIAAALTAPIATVVIGLLAKAFGVDLDIGTATAIVGPLLLAAATFAAAALAGPGEVVVIDPAEDHVGEDEAPPARGL